MTKLLFPLGLFTVLLGVLLRTVSGANLTDLFIVQGGRTNGGCDDYYNQITKTGILDNWHEEISFALANAIDRIDQDYNQDIRVRRVLKTFFNISPSGRASGRRKDDIDKIVKNLQYVKEFFDFHHIEPDDDDDNSDDSNNGNNNEEDDDSSDSDGNNGDDDDDDDNLVPAYPLDGDRYLFCGSDFLIEEAIDTPARDWNAQGILDDNGNIVTIADVPGYAKALAEDKTSKAWWSGDFTPVNGYYFSPTGGNYCNGDGLGLTAVVKELNEQTRTDGVQSVIICGSSFTSAKPDNYRDGDARIEEGTNLADVVPKSATLLHEAFHVIFGGGDTGFLEGDDEIYDIASCINAGKKKAMRNPESYVFLVTHLYYLFGEEEAGDPGTSINTNWDFAVVEDGADRVFGAKKP